jgi:hypothetical protein
MNKKPTPFTVISSASDSKDLLEKEFLWMQTLSKQFKLYNATNNDGTPKRAGNFTRWTKSI